MHKLQAYSCNTLEKKSLEKEKKLNKNVIISTTVNHTYIPNADEYVAKFKAKNAVVSCLSLL